MSKIEPGQIIATEEIKSSSSDNVYIVTLYDNCISCTCPAGGKKTLCKHALSVINQNLDFLRDNCPAFYNQISEIIKTKKLPNSKELYKQLASEIIFVNRELAEKSHDNAINIKTSTKRNFENIIEIIENTFNDNQKEALLEILQKIKPHCFKTIMYLNRRLKHTIDNSYYDFYAEEYVHQEDNYTAGGKLVDELLKKYGSTND